MMLIPAGNVNLSQAFGPMIKAIVDLEVVCREEFVMYLSDNGRGMKHCS